MDFDNLKYDIQKNKEKLMLIGAIIFFIVAAILVFKIFGNKLDYGTASKDSISKKYVLATNILGCSSDGVVNLYNTKTGEIVASKKVGEGEFICSNSSDMKKLNTFNITTKELYVVTSKGKNINSSKISTIDLEKYNISSFKYEGDYFVGLLNGDTKFIVVNMKESKSKIVDLKLMNPISNYEIVDENIIFTSGEYICTAKLTDGKGDKINIGEYTNSIHVTKNKVFIHNAFGYDRNKSILLDINPKTLYINKAYEFKDSKVNILKTSSESEILYYSEAFLTSSEGKIKQVIKTIGEELKKPAALMKYTGGNFIDNLNSYGNLGYVYYRNNETLEIFNLKNMEKEYSLKIKDNFYMPIY